MLRALREYSTPVQYSRGLLVDCATTLQEYRTPTIADEGGLVRNRRIEVLWRNDGSDIAGVKVGGSCNARDLVDDRAWISSSLHLTLRWCTAGEL